MRFIIIYNGITNIKAGDGLMFVIFRKMVVIEGNADKIIDRFSKPGILDEQEGFVDVTVLTEKARRGEQGVIVQIRWESEDHWKQWEKSDAHLAAHSKNKGKPKPDYIISQEGFRYTVQAVKTAEK